MDDRWSDPSRTPLSNGPLRATTAPTASNIKFGENGKLFEFLLPFPMHVVDSVSWTPLEVGWQGLVIQLLKPVFIMEPYQPKGRYGNEAPDAFCSILRAFLPEQRNSRDTSAADIWPLMHLLLMWVRVKCRHFWLLSGSAGFGALFRGSSFFQSLEGVRQENFGTYGRNLIVRPLTKEVWDTLANELAAGLQPPVSESMLCDAFASAVAGDYGKTVLELGVAAEVELTQLLSDVSQLAPQSPGRQAHLQEGDWDQLRFSKKLNKWTVETGLVRPEEFTRPYLPAKWKETVEYVYKLRNSVAHSGVLPADARGTIGDYIFGTSAIFSYCRAQRRSVGLQSYSYPGEHADPSVQLQAFVGG